VKDPLGARGAALARRDRGRSRLGSVPSPTEPLIWGGTERRPTRLRRGERKHRRGSELRARDTCRGLPESDAFVGMIGG
jgi:hypothetical protein